MSGQAHYRFLTTWLVAAPIERVWDVIYAIDRWPEWWRGVQSVTELVHGDGTATARGPSTGTCGARRSPTRSGSTPPVEEVREPHLILARAEGGLAGTGTFRLFESPLGTAVTYDWRVHTTKPWMNAVAPVARPVFAWNHHAVMNQGGIGLARVLGVELVAQSSS